MDNQTQMFLVGALLLIAGAAIMWALTKYGPKLGGVTNVLNAADATLGGLVTADKTIGAAIIPAPAQAIIGMILGVAQAGVHEAQQLFDSGQITDEQRKDQAVQSAERLLKIAGYTPTPELNAALTGAVEAGVFLMKRQTLNTDTKEPPATELTPVPQEETPAETPATALQAVSPEVTADTKTPEATIAPAAVQASAQQVIQNAMLTAASQAKQDLHAAIDQAAQTATTTPTA